MPNPTIETARQLLAKNDFKKVFETLRPRASGAESDDLIALESNLNGIEHDHGVKGLSYEKYQEGKNQIRSALLKLMQEMEGRLPASNQPDSRHFTRIPHPGYVVGRDLFLKNLHETLTEKSETALVQGLGGIGKTTVALAYTHHPEYAVTYDHIIYIEISSTLCNAFTGHPELAKSLRAEAEVQTLLTQNNFDGACCALLDALGRLGGRNLLVLDNANDREEMRHWKRDLQRARCRLLVTSRADIPNFTHLRVEELDMADAQTLFAHHFGPVAESDTEILAALLDLVERHTLLTEMLGKIGKQARYTVAELRNYVQEGFIRNPRLQRRVETGALTERKGLDEATLLDVTRFLFDGIAPGLSEREHDYLRWLAILPPRSFSSDLLVQLFRIPDEERPAWEADMDDLEKKGVPLHRGREYGLHRVMREVILEAEGCTIENCEPVIEAVTELLEVDQTKDNPVDKFQWIGLGEAIMAVFEEEYVPEISHLRNNLAWVYNDFGIYERAKSLLETALKSDLKNFGNEHPTLATSQSNLATVYSSLGQYEKARDLLKATLESAVKNFGNGHQNVALRQANLALVYKNLGQYEEARDLLESALESYLKNFGNDHPSVARSQANLATVYLFLGQYEKARNLLEAALESDLKNFGLGHPNVTANQANLATVYLFLGQYEKARNLLEAALESDLKNFGPEHPNIAIHQSNLAKVYSALGQYEKARDLLEAALDSDLKNFGNEHPYTAIDQAIFAGILKHLSEGNAAIEMMQKAYSTCLKLLGPEHPHTKNSAKALRDWGAPPDTP